MDCVTTRLQMEIGMYFLSLGYQGGVVPTPYGFLHITLVAYEIQFLRLSSLLGVHLDTFGDNTFDDGPLRSKVIHVPKIPTVPKRVDTTPFGLSTVFI